MSVPATERNTRQVATVRLAEGERRQIEAAAASRGVTPSAFLREAALWASAVATRKAEPVAAEVRPRDVARAADAVALPVFEAPRWVDGQLLNPDRVDPELLSDVSEER